MAFVCTDNNCHMGYLGCIFRDTRKTRIPFNFGICRMGDNHDPVRIGRTSQYSLETRHSLEASCLEPDRRHSRVRWATSFISGIKTRASLHHFPYYLACANCNRDHVSRYLERKGCIHKPNRHHISFCINCLLFHFRQ